jgi:hypothetical protein
MTDELICPFCKGENHCMARSEQPCWCIEAQIPASLLDLVPVEFKNRSCICPGCINLFASDAESFKAKYLA